ncbi:MAG TPA: hypothetical protein VFS43_11315 [Polyangiaceae bacterium]|nr:hypothetical protein [Polyangiaceae bacterium]
MRPGADAPAEPEFLGYLARREARRWPLVAVGAFAAAALALWLWPRAPLPWPVPLLGACALLPFGGGRRTRRLRVSAGPGWLAFDDGRRRPVAGGHLCLDARDVATLRLEPEGRAGGRLELVAEEADQGRRLLRALRLDAAHATAAFRVTAGSWNANARDLAVALVVAAALAAAALAVRWLRFFSIASGLFELVLYLALLPVGWLAFVTWRRRRRVLAEVGVEGVATTSAYGRRAYYPFERVEAIDDGRFDIVLTERSGARAFFTAEGLEEFEAFSQRLAEAFALYRAAAREGETWKVLLPPESATTAAWLARLRTLGGGGSQGYRSLGLERARLLALALAPSVPPLGRAASAFVLFERATPAELERLDAAARRTAHPALRAMLDGVVRGDREETTRAIDELRAAEAGAWGALGAG